MKQSKIEIHHDKKLVLKLPMQDESSSGSAPAPKRTSSPIYLTLTVLRVVAQAEKQEVPKERQKIVFQMNPKHRRKKKKR